MASESTQPFCHSTLSDRHTDTHTHRPTNGLGDRSVRRALTLAELIHSDERSPIRYSVQLRECRQSVQWQYHSNNWNFFPSIVEGESLVLCRATEAT